ncbi:MAG: hypothetical protein E5X09_19675 [Mesorhizobium sp.]|nr:MAG: hypothetical protein E5X09_19675 [Mesorhizobium sp.]
MGSYGTDTTSFDLRVGKCFPELAALPPPLAWHFPAMSRPQSEPFSYVGLLDIYRKAMSALAAQIMPQKLSPVFRIEWRCV